MLASSTWASTMRYLTWKAKATKHKRLLFRLVPSKPRTKESDYFLWATPDSADCVGSHGGGQGRSLRTDIHNWKKGLWPTPHANCYTGIGIQGREGGMNIQTAVKMWPTPNATDYKGVSQPLGRRPACDDDLPGRVAREMFPSPAARDWKSGRGRKDNGHTPQLPEVIGGQLNPMWVEWLMGFPIGWTDLEG